MWRSRILSLPDPTPFFLRRRPHKKENKKSHVKRVTRAPRGENGGRDGKRKKEEEKKTFLVATVTRSRPSTVVGDPKSNSGAVGQGMSCIGECQAAVSDGTHQSVHVGSTFPEVKDANLRVSLPPLPPTPASCNNIKRRGAAFFRRVRLARCTGMPPWQAGGPTAALRSFGCDERDESSLGLSCVAPRGRRAPKCT